MKSYSKRFKRLAQLLFTSEISDEEKSVGRQIADMFDKIEIDLKKWIDTIENNMNVFRNFHGGEKSLVNISQRFEEVQKKQKENYERIIQSIKQGIELINTIQDVEMQEMVANLGAASEEFTEMYNEITDMQLKIGEDGFIQQFKDASQKIVDNNKFFFDVLERIQDYVMKNVLDEQALS